VEYSRGRELGDHSSWEHIEVLEPQAAPAMGVLMPRCFTVELIMPVFEAIVMALQNWGAGIESSRGLCGCTTLRSPRGFDSMIFECGMRRLEANGESRNRLCRPYRSGGGREAGAAASELTNRMSETYRFGRSPKNGALCIDNAVSSP
jgi:hypothetical protein